MTRPYYSAKYINDTGKCDVNISQNNTVSYVPIPIPGILSKKLLSTYWSCVVQTKSYLFMTKWRTSGKKKQSSKHVVTSCVWVFTWWEPQNTVKSIRSHWPTRRWWGLFCYWKNMGHFSITRTILILVSPLVNPQFHQWLAGRNGWQAAVSMSICGKLPLA